MHMLCHAALVLHFKTPSSTEIHNAISMSNFLKQHGITVRRECSLFNSAEIVVGSVKRDISLTRGEKTKQLS